MAFRALPHTPLSALATLPLNGASPQYVRDHLVALIDNLTEEARFDLWQLVCLWATPSPLPRRGPPESPP
jgi:hypothetical protein